LVVDEQKIPCRLINGNFINRWNKWKKISFVCIAIEC
jgi:hypothetical protein